MDWSQENFSPCMKKKHQGYLNLGGWTWRQEPERGQVGQAWDTFLILDLSSLSQNKELIVATDIDIV